MVFLMRYSDHAVDSVTKRLGAPVSARTCNSVLEQIPIGVIGYVLVGPSGSASWGDLSGGMVVGFSLV